MKHQGTSVTTAGHTDYSQIQFPQNVRLQRFLAKVMKNLKGANAFHVEMEMQNPVEKWVIILIKHLEEEVFIS